jgi:hypothetical protein
MIEHNKNTRKMPHPRRPKIAMLLTLSPRLGGRDGQRRPMDLLLILLLASAQHASIAPTIDGSGTNIMRRAFWLGVGSLSPARYAQSITTATKHQGI